MAVIKPFPKGGRRSRRRRWQTSSGAPGNRAFRPPHRSRPPSSGGPSLTGLAILIVLGLIAVFAVAQSAANSNRPKPADMANYDFGTCKEAREAGAAPLMRGEPWYRSYLDEDRDGVACEAHPKAFLDDLLR